MISGDNEAAARETARMFDDPRVHQYWDPNRLTGLSYSQHVYPSYLTNLQTTLNSTLPADHWWRTQGIDLGRSDAGKSPLWDVAFTYSKGAVWGERPPEPLAMVKQVAFYGAQDDGTSGMFVTDFKKAAIDTDWAVELAKAMIVLTGRKPAPATAQADSSAKQASGGAECQGNLQAELMLISVPKMSDDSTADRIAATVRAIDGVLQVTADSKTKLVQFIAFANSGVTVERAIETLRLAGFEARAATQPEEEQAAAAMQAAGPVVIVPRAPTDADDE